MIEIVSAGVNLAYSGNLRTQQKSVSDKSILLFSQTSLVKSPRHHFGCLTPCATPTVNTSVFISQYYLSNQSVDDGGKMNKLLILLKEKKNPGLRHAFVHINKLEDT